MRKKILSKFSIRTLALIIFPACAALTTVTIIVVITQLPVIKQYFVLLQQNSAGAQQSTGSALPLALTNTHVMGIAYLYSLSGTVKTISPTQISLNDSSLPLFKITQNTRYYQSTGTNQSKATPLNQIKQHGTVLLSATYDPKTQTWTANSITIRSSTEKQPFQLGD